MCFSATASFVASGGLAAIGVASLKTADKKHKLLATIPLIFALQQAIEGIQWLLPHPGDICIGVGYAYLFFAYLFWPIYIPFVLSIIDDQRAKLMRWYMYLGILLSAYLLGVMMFVPLDVQLIYHSIGYYINVPFQDIAVAIYAIVVFGSLLSSSKSLIQWFGVALFASAVVSGFFFFNAFTSTWCFFGAILSSLVYFYIRQHVKNKKQ